MFQSPTFLKRFLKVLFLKKCSGGPQRDVCPPGICKKNILRKITNFWLSLKIVLRNPRYILDKNFTKNNNFCHEVFEKDLIKTLFHFKDLLIGSP